MPTDQLVTQVHSLREQGHTPKQIARTLGIKPAEAARLVRVAAARGLPSERELAGCWVSPTWSTGLGVDDHPDWPVDEHEGVGTDGLVSVLVARRHRNGKVSVCGYLVDVYCLGVKNALGPETMDDVGLRDFVQAFFDGYHDDPLEAPIELARELVFGSVDYARTLGFEPHSDFEATKGHLGKWTGPSTITFGKNGKPYYISGPHDDPEPVINTLEKTVGKDNYDYLAVPF